MTPLMNLRLDTAFGVSSMIRKSAVSAIQEYLSYTQATSFKENRANGLPVPASRFQRLILNALLTESQCGQRRRPADTGIQGREISRRCEWSGNWNWRECRRCPPASPWKGGANPAKG